MRVGIGYDSHRFSQGRRLLLGGVEIPDSPGLSGHSDGDAVLHALIDALLGAAALGNIGALYPDTDPVYEGADSTTLLADTARRLAAAGLGIGNVDITVIAERPKIQPHVPAMIERITSVLGLGPGAVSVKGKSNEGMGWIGRGEGIAVIAVATLVDLAARDPDKTK